MNIDRAAAKRVIETVDAGLVSGLGEPVPGQMCVEAAVCYALGLEHSDEPRCVSAAVRALKIRLNDSSWSSDQARAKGLRKLAVLQLGTKENFDQKHFIESVILMTVREFVAPMFDRKWPEHAAALRAAETMEQIRSAARVAGAARAVADADAYAARAANASASAAAAADAARAVADAYAAGAADAAAYASAHAAAAYAAADAANAAAAAAAYAAANAAANAAAAYAAARDEVLQRFADRVADILIEMNVPGVAFLDLL